MAHVRLLIVEDDLSIYKNMMEALERELNGRDIAAIIEHATYHAEARRKLKEFDPQVVSTDMAFPLLSDTGIDTRAGAKLVSHINYRRSTPCLVYSSFPVADCEERLCDAGLVSFPPILVKDAMCGHGEWAKALAELLLKFA